MSTTRSIVTDLAQGLGALVWWDLAGTSVRADDLRSILAAEGMDPSVVPDPDPIAEARRSAREWSQGRGGADRWRAEVVGETADSVQVGILRRERVSADEVRWVQHDRVEWTRASGGWSTPTGNARAEAVSFVSLATERQTHLDHTWIRPKLVQAELARMGAFRLRRQGGVEFVPRQHLDGLAALQRVVGRIGDSYMRIAHVAPTEESRASVGGEARRSIGDTVQEVRARLEEWRTAARAPRSDAAANLLGELAEVRAKAQLYESALEVSLADLRAELDAAREDALALLGLGAVVAA